MILKNFFATGLPGAAARCGRGRRRLENLGVWDLGDTGIPGNLGVWSLGDACVWETSEER